MVRHYRWTRYTTQGGTIRLPVRVSELASAGKAGDPGLWGAHEPANGDDPCQRVDDRDELERSIMPYLSEKCARILEDLACGQSWSEIYQKYGYKTKASCRESFYQNIRGLAAKGILSRVTI
jgi:hypothetical protein